MPSSKKIGAWLKEQREQRGLSQGKVATYLECSRSFVAQMEIGSSSVPKRFVFGIARAFGLPPKKVWGTIWPDEKYNPLVGLRDMEWAAQSGFLKPDSAAYFKSYQPALPVFDAQAGQPWGWALVDRVDTTGETEYLRGHEIGYFPAPPDSQVEKCFWAKVSGDDSMAPTLGAGDLVLVEKLDPINGRLCFVIPTGAGKTKDARLVRRYFRSDDGTSTLAADNQAGGFPPIVMPAPKHKDGTGRSQQFRVHRVSFLLKRNP
ncbi:MAG: LexA family transcriptional regulator [Proteobacteria bacterium]|nr:LexA family transcriptional regulator [Pseudomonadota bacterium]MBU1740735.1 LexA family transcriptional regulator [Pseudomonadota bacterium]